MFRSHYTNQFKYGPPQTHRRTLSKYGIKAYHGRWAADLGISKKTLYQWFSLKMNWFSRC
jgi:hypothetical protein